MGAKTTNIQKTYYIYNTKGTPNERIGYFYIQFVVVRVSYIKCL